MMLPLLFLLFLFQSDSPPPGYTPGIKITMVSHDGSPDAIETTMYLQQDRSRVESRYQDGRPIGGVSVVRCDMRQSLYFSPDSLTYDARPYPPPRITEAGARAWGFRTTPNYRTVEPTLRLETTYQDTGERKEFSGFTARHMIITERQIPLEDRRSLPRTEVRDGWYINLGKTSCEQQYAVESKDDPVIYPTWTIEYIQTVTTGDVPDPAESRMPVEEKEIEWETVMSSDGAKKERFLSGSKRRITKIEEVPMDPALFGPPAWIGHARQLEVR